MSRIMAFLSPGADPPTRGLPGPPALYALAAGGLFGWAWARAVKWNLLPNAQNDYIFAIIGEELGFLGCVRGAGPVRHAGLRRLPHRPRVADPWSSSCVATPPSGWSARPP